MAKDFKELIAWQCADAIRAEVIATTRQSRDIDLRFKSQWTDAAGSVCSNLAEGFGRFSHRDFARFVRQARASLFEVENQTREARQRGYISTEKEAELNQMIRRATVPITRLLRYLQTTPDP